MFKKQLDIKPTANLKSSDRKKIQNLVPEFPLPKTISHAIFTTQTIKKGTLYFDNSGKSIDPLFFKTRDSEVFYPTLYALWLIPNLLPVIYTHAFVVERLINGADLMIAGCLPPFDNKLVKGSLCAVADIDRPDVAVAVGELMMDLDDVTDVRRMSGVVVRIGTVVGDKLTSMGRDVADVIADRPIIEVQSGIEDLNVNNDIKEDIIQREINDRDEDGNEIENGNENKNKNHDNENDEKTEKVNQNDVEEDNFDEYILTTKDIDDFFVRSVLYSISQDEFDLPMSSSQFISSHVLKNLPPCDTTQVTIKRTSWRKTSKFLKSMEKLKLLGLKGKDEDLVIVSVASKDDERVKNFVPYRTRKVKKQVKNDDDKKELIVNSLLKGTSQVRGIFNRLDKHYDAYYTDFEVKKMIAEYITKSGVVDLKDPKNIEPDQVLKNLGIKSKISRVKAVEMIMKKFSSYYTIYREGDEKSVDVMVKKRFTPKRGSIPKIYILIEQLKFGRKLITRVSGFENYFIDVEELSSLLKFKCSGATSINETKQGGLEINVQGSHEKNVLDVLKTYGIKENWCEINDKVKAKKKRKN